MNLFDEHNALKLLAVLTLDTFEVGPKSFIWMTYKKTNATFTNSIDKVN